MVLFRRSLTVISMAVFISIFLVACGNAQSPTATSNNNMDMNSQSGSPMSATPTKATMPGYNYGTTPTATGNNDMNPTPSMNDGGNMKAFIHTTVVTLNGQKVHVLTNNKGFLLYYTKNDMMLTSSCTGGCAQSWPPLLAPSGMMTVDSSVMLPKKLSIHKTANGNQVFYDGHALYTYAGDMTAGQFNGRGMGNVWYLVGINL